MLAGCSASPRTPPPPEYPGLTLVWRDEFDTDGPVNERDWIYEKGFVRNKEAQWYQPANVTCRDGVLIIEARRESVPNPGHVPGSQDWRAARPFAEYSSGSIKTRGKREWTFGRFQMRGRIDIRPGCWPAFWTVGVARPWPACGEIDIMEYFRSTLLANCAWGSPRPGVGVWDDVKVPIADIAAKCGFQSPEAWAAQFHVWRMDWDRQSIRFFVDDVPLNQVDLTRTINQTPDKANPFHEPHHIILNLAIGGTSGGDPSNTSFPARFEVDWVRVYQPATPAAR
jgi:beta-glucanase (GH16 family)